jgi:hypothetical protein
LPPIASQSPISKSSCGSGTNRGASITCRLTCPIAWPPKLAEHYERVKNDPRVKAYYAKHGLTG